MNKFTLSLAAFFAIVILLHALLPQTTQSRDAALEAKQYREQHVMEFATR
jgi:preprotein translocase subunit SecG